ncbi:hypothetical protein BH10BDE1_BH10BDE1_17810 [soil metagenome]
MKFISCFFLASGFIGGVNASAFTPPAHELQFEIEVASCPEGSISLTQLEYPFIKGTPLSVSPQNFEDTFVAPMRALSPVRAEVLRQFSNQMWAKLKPLVGVTLRPLFPSTALFHRADCSVSVVASVTATANSISGVLNSDLWSTLTTETKNILMAEAYFHFERTAWILQTFSENQEWNPTRSRFFLIEWLTPKTRPSDRAGFFALAGRAELAFIEQSGVLIPFGPHPPEWNAVTGLVRVSREGYRSRLWTSPIVLKGPRGDARFPYEGWYREENDDQVLFYDDGSIHCLPSAQNYAINQVGPSDVWSGRLCVFPDGSIESGYLVVPWGNPLDWKFGSTMMTIDRDPLAGGTDQGTDIRFFPDLSIKEIGNSSGIVSLQGRSVEVTGPLKFEKVLRRGVEVPRLKCASLPPKTNWLDAKGQRVAVQDRAQTFCFDQQERVISSCHRPFCGSEAEQN